MLRVLPRILEYRRYPDIERILQKKKKIEQNTRNKTKGSVKLAKLKKSQLHAVYFAEIYTLLSRVANKTYTQNNAFRSM